MNKPLRDQAEPEFSRRIPVDRISHRPIEITIEPSPAEREALALRFDLQALDSLTATLTLKSVRGEMVEVRGSLSADVVQTCVVTLEPVKNHVEDAFDALFAPVHLVDEQSGREIELDIDAEDPPEPILNGAIDIGELTAQHLSLALDPYPRCPDAPVEALLGGGSGQTEESGPFAALRKLRRDT